MPSFSPRQTLAYRLLPPYLTWRFDNRFDNRPFIGKSLDSTTPSPRGAERASYRGTHYGASYRQPPSSPPPIRQAVCWFSADRPSDGPLVQEGARPRHLFR